MTRYESYARIVLSQTETLAKLLRYYAGLDQQQQTGIAALKLLSTEDINRALKNPQSSIHLSMQALAELIRTEQECHQLETELDLLKQEASMRIQDESVKHELDSIRQELAKARQELAEYYQQLYHLTEEQDRDWQNFRKDRLKQINQLIQSNEIPLNEFEQRELEQAEIWQEVVDRFDDLSLDLPSFINTEKPNRASYFQLKVYLALHSSLSRRMLPHSEEDIKKIWPK